MALEASVTSGVLDRIAISDLTVENRRLKLDMLAFQDEERRRWALDRVMGIFNPDDIEKQAVRIERYVRTGSFEGDPA